VTATSGQAAIANGDRYHTYEVGMCLKWVRGPCWEIGSLYASAIDAWEGARIRHPGDRTPPPGAPLFYAGGTYGHIVIAQYDGSGRMRSTDCPTSGQVSDADLSWPETAWGDTYLGWTEDLNGVQLPLTPPPPPPPPPEEPMPEWIRARMTKTVTVKPDAWLTLAWDAVPSGADVVTPGETAIRIGGTKFTGALTVAAEVAGGLIRTRFLERSKHGDAWETDETYPVVEHLPTTDKGVTHITDARVQGVADGRRLVAQINLGSAGGTVTGAEFNALYF
jgi:hypothetical protein